MALPAVIQSPRRALAPQAVVHGLDDGLVFGCAVSSGELYGVPAGALDKHLLMVGASGHGKSNQIEVLVRQRILSRLRRKQSLILIDPHGSTVGAIIKWLASTGLWRHVPVRVLDCSDPITSVGMNFCKRWPGVEPDVMADERKKAILQVWGQDSVTQTPRINSVLGELLYALTYIDLSLREAEIFLRGDDSDGVREHLLEQLPYDCAEFFRNIYRLGDDRVDEYFESTRSRLRPFLRSPQIRRMLGQESNLDVAETMDEGGVLLISTRPGQHLSHENSRVLRVLLMTEIYLAGFRRQTDIPCLVVVDEAADCLTPDAARTLEENRKHKISMALALQHLEQARDASQRVYSAIMGNTHVKVSMGGLEPGDARLLAESMFFGHLSLEKPKASMIRPTVVGQRITRLASEGETDGTTNTMTGTRGVTTTTGKTESNTTSRVTTDGSSHTVSRSTTLVDMLSATTSDADDSDATTTTEGESVAETDGEASTTSHAETHGQAHTAGTSATQGTQTSTSRSHGRTHSTTSGWSEAFENLWEDLPTQLHTFEEVLYLAAAEIATVPIDELFVSVGNAMPVRLAAPYVGGTVAAPSVLARTQEALKQTPWSLPAEEVEAMVERRRWKLQNDARKGRRDSGNNRQNDAPAAPNPAFNFARVVR